MRIGIVSSDFPPYVGGMASHVYELSKTLGAQGHRVWVIASNPRCGPAQVTEDGFEIHRVSIRDIRRTKNLQFVLRAGMLLRRLVKENNIEIVHCHGLYPDAVATKFVLDNAPVVFTNHSSQFLMTVKNKRVHPWLRFQLSHMQKIIAPSRELALATESLGISPKKIIYIPNGVSHQQFCPLADVTPIRKRLGIADNAIVVLSPRRLVPKNGVVYFARAVPMILKAVSQARFVFVGDGPERDIIIQELRTSGVMEYVTWVGEVPNSEMPDYIAASDIVVLPSLMEATSIAGLEAMACGKPLVGTCVGGLPEIIEDRVTGIVVPPADPTALADAIIELVISHSKRMDMGRAARKRVTEEFSWHTIAQKTVEVYREVQDSVTRGKL